MKKLAGDEILYEVLLLEQLLIRDCSISKNLRKAQLIYEIAAWILHSFKLDNMINRKSEGESRGFFMGQIPLINFLRKITYLLLLIVISNNPLLEYLKAKMGKALNN